MQFCTIKPDFIDTKKMLKSFKIGIAKGFLIRNHGRVSGIAGRQVNVLLKYPDTDIRPLPERET
jgi:hypothetical protein